MKVYRDYGSLGNSQAPNEFDLIRYSQVYQATHDGELRLPYGNRSFISFSYGGRNIEDFNLIAYTNGDRLERAAYGEFEDLTTTYDVIHGQFYWGTYFRARSLTLNLATDGITQEQLDEFRYWFRPGETRELILSEHPNRATMARIAQPPELHLLPFEEPAYIGMNDSLGSRKEYKFSTTLYKGEITLEFVMDEPFWYSKQNILGKQNKIEGYFDDDWTDANGNPVNIRNGNPDVLKIILEDRIPLGTNVDLSVFFGDSVFAFATYEFYSKIVKKIPTFEEYDRYKNSSDSKISKGVFEGTEDNQTVYYSGARIMSDEAVAAADDILNITNLGTIAGAAFQSEDKVSNVDLGSSAKDSNGTQISSISPDSYYLYYPGTAPSPVTIEFTITPQFDENHYIVAPYSLDHCHTETINGESVDISYNKISLKAQNTFEFRFSLPSLWYNYNKAMKILNTSGIEQAKLQERLNNEVKHAYIRKAVNYFSSIYNTTTTNSKSMIYVRESMQKCFNNQATFIFNGATGEAKGTFNWGNFNNYDWTEIQNELSSMIGQNQGIYVRSFHYDNSQDEQLQLAIDNYAEFQNTVPYQIYSEEQLYNWKNQYQEILNRSELNINIPNILSRHNNSIVNITSIFGPDFSNQRTENVGDMVKGKYLILEERNILNSNYQVEKWSQELFENKKATANYCYEIRQDLPMDMKNLKFSFKNMYL